MFIPFRETYKMLWTQTSIFPLPRIAKCRYPIKIPNTKYKVIELSSLSHLKHESSSLPASYSRKYSLHKCSHTYITISIYKPAQATRLLAFVVVAAGGTVTLCGRNMGVNIAVVRAVLAT